MVGPPFPDRERNERQWFLDRNLPPPAPAVTQLRERIERFKLIPRYKALATEEQLKALTAFANNPSPGDQERMIQANAVPIDLSERGVSPTEIVKKTVHGISQPLEIAGKAYQDIGRGAIKAARGSAPGQLFEHFLRTGRPTVPREPYYEFEPQSIAEAAGGIIPGLIGLGTPQDYQYGSSFTEAMAGIPPGEFVGAGALGPLARTIDIARATRNLRNVPQAARNLGAGVSGARLGLETGRGVVKGGTEKRLPFVNAILADLKAIRDDPQKWVGVPEERRPELLREIATLERMATPPAYVYPKRGQPPVKPVPINVTPIRPSIRETRPPLVPEGERPDLKQLMYEARAKLDGLLETRRPVPKFGTPERAEFDNARRMASEKGQRIIPKAQAIAKLREEIRSLKDQIAHESITMTPGTTLQGAMGIGEKPQPVKMFEEFQGKGQKPTLVDVEALKASQAAKPLLGQQDLFANVTTIQNQLAKTPRGSKSRPLMEALSLAEGKLEDSRLAVALRGKTEADIVVRRYAKGPTGVPIWRASIGDIELAASTKGIADAHGIAVEDFRRIVKQRVGPDVPRVPVKTKTPLIPGTPEYITEVNRALKALGAPPKLSAAQATNEDLTITPFTPKEPLVKPMVESPVEAVTPTLPSVEAIHKLADSKKIPWDDDPVFMKFTQDITGKPKLDDLTPMERDQVFKKLKAVSGKLPQAVTPPPAPPAKPPVGTVRPPPGPPAPPPAGRGLGSTGSQNIKAVLPKLPTIEEVLQTDFQRNAAQRLGEKIASIPGVRAVATQANPSVRAQSLPRKAMIAYQGLGEAGDTGAHAAVDQLRAIGNVWKLDSDGNVLNMGPTVPNLSRDYHDVLTFPQHYPLNAEQKQWAQTFYTLREDRLKTLRTKGIPITELLDFSDAATVQSLSIHIGGQGELFPRVITGKRVKGELLEKAGADIRRRVGARQSQQRPRVFPTVQQGKEAGYVYMNNPEQEAEIFFKAAYRLEADYDLASFIRKQPGVRVGANPDPFSEGSIFDQPAFRNMVLPKEMAEDISKALRDEGNSFLRSISNVNDMSRMLTTGFDPGFILIQGGLPLLRHPPTWGKATAIALRVFFQSPTVYAKYIRDNMATIQKMVTYRAAPLASSEFVESGSRGVISRIPGGKRAALSFNTFLDVGRIELHKALGHLAKTPAEYRALTNVIDHMLGVSSSRQLGLSTTARQAESALALFAPRYRRAGAALMTEAFQGGIRGDQARKALAAFTFGGLAVMTGVAYALGQQNRILPTKDRPIPLMFDPRTGKFMAVRIHNTEVGIGGVIVSNYRALARMYNAGSEGDVVDVLAEAGRIYRGQAAPATSAGINVILGKTFQGDPLWTKDQMLQMIADKTLPFWIDPYITEGVLDELSPMPGPERALASLAGGRERAISPAERQAALRDEIAHSSGLLKSDGQPVSKWADLNKSQREDLEEQSPGLNSLQEQVRALRYRQAAPNVKARLDQDEAARQTFYEAMAKNVKSLKSSKALYDKQRSTIRAEYRGKREALWGIRIALEADSVQAIEKYTKAHQAPEDAALEAYWQKQTELIENAEILDKLTWSRIENKLRVWLLQSYPDQISYINQHKDDWIKDLPEPTRAVEIKRASLLKNGLWWHNYRQPASYLIPRPSSQTAPKAPVGRELVPAER